VKHRAVRGPTVIALIDQPHTEMPGQKARRSAPIIQRSEKTVEDNQIGALAQYLAVKFYR
jgi:hypothetical protein